jgi:hypothetical protein
MFSFAWWCASAVGVVFVFAGVQKILAGPDWLVRSSACRVGAVGRIHRAACCAPSRGRTPAVLVFRLSVGQTN